MTISRMIGLCASFLFASPALATTAWDLEIVPLKPDVYLLRRQDPLRQLGRRQRARGRQRARCRRIRRRGPAARRENAIRLIRSITEKPVSHLVNSHWHGDHNLGNQAYRTAFPGVTIVGHPRTREAMLGAPMKYVKEFDKDIGPTIAEWTALEEKGELSEGRTVLLADLRLLLADSKRIDVTPPDLTVADELVLHRGAREIHVRHLGRGNTDGDLVLWLPKERIVATGDLVVHPIPYGFGSFPREWIETLGSLKQLDFELLVPGHGEVQRDRAYVDLLATMLAAMREQTAAAVAKGLDLEATRKTLDFSAFESRFPQQEMGPGLFEAWWKSPIGRSLWLEAKDLPILQADSSENN